MEKKKRGRRKGGRKKGRDEAKEGERNVSVGISLFTHNTPHTPSQP